MSYNKTLNNNNKPKWKYCCYPYRVRYFIWLCIIIVVILIHRAATRNTDVYSAEYWTYPADYFQFTQVNIVLKRYGYRYTGENKSWRLLWLWHDRPNIFGNQLKLKKYQKVNFIPGIENITEKSLLSTSGLKYIPKAFILPAQKEELIEYAKKSKGTLFLEKNKSHEGIILKNVSDLDYNSNTKFVQEFVQKPFLVDGHMFDIGVFVAITSVNPLRAYWYKGDILFRFCPSKYYPFNASDVTKYIVNGNYLKPWKVPSIKFFMTKFGFGMKDSFDAYAKSVGKDTTLMWDEVQNALVEILVNNEKNMVAAANAMKGASSTNFFQLVRADLLVDEDLKVYLTEVNHSPSLASLYEPIHQVLNQQVLYNLFSLVGVLTPINSNFQCQPEEKSDIDLILPDTTSKPSAKDMFAADKNIAVWADECVSCLNTCKGICRLCMPCLTLDMRATFLEAYREHLHRGDFRRIFPPAMHPGSSPDQIEALDNLSPVTKAQYLWMQGKCNMDVTWCT